MFFTVYYAEKGDQMLHHFKGKIDIGIGNGGLLSQLKLQNEMRLTDESWINYQKGKGNEEFQKYMEDLTDMQNHVLPYLQSFCSLEVKRVQERREQQIADDVPIMAVTNHLTNLGAASSIFCKRIQKRLEDIFPDGFYLIPSSVHEFLAVDKKISTPESLKEIISDTNRDIVDAKDQLSNAAYYFENEVFLKTLM